jgi:L-seryl-tRNA(Ser) seleniumtransferase
MRSRQTEVSMSTSTRPRPPSVDALLREAEGAESLEDMAGRDRSARTTVAREVVAEERAALAAGKPARTLVELVDAYFARWRWLGDPDAGPKAVGLERALNATGVILHTNLGRAPWSWHALSAVLDSAAVPLLLEIDRASGRRGKRVPELEDEIRAVTGAEAALVVNNNAAAVALAVGLAGREGVAVSRGELVEIGGGVRIPELVRRAGARLVEVGTTNRTRVEDFEEALAEGRAKVVLRVHPSNFSQSGFVEAPAFAGLAEAVHRHGAILIDDLGSGALLDTAQFGLAHEPMPSERLAAGADLVTFSGDKLVGGPQAGIVAGRADLVARLRKDPFARAMRPDKVILAALVATLRLYRRGEAVSEIPIWRQIAATVEDLEARARRLETLIAMERVRAAPTTSTIGGGSLPGQTQASWAVAITEDAPDAVLAALRQGDPPVIGRIEDGRVLLDLRTIDPDDDAVLQLAIRAALAG